MGSPRRAIGAAGAALILLTGCGPEYIGTVTDKSGAGKYRRLTVEEPSGEKHRFRPTRPDFKSCQVGDAWPACKQGS